MFASFAFFF